MAKLAVLRHEEGVRLNPDCLVALYAELGETGAEQIVARAMEELAARLSEIQRHADERNAAGVARAARLLIKVAEQIGMTSFASVAGDVLTTSAAGEAVAQAATLARLVRIGDRSLTAVWDLRDMTI
ncbi:hypothetical protein DEA8626_03527 [Defluviimonas aquaemixtae]|uniref:HPt domain-containing protein n=1 Tax=Albidovulum aquaemixtae TaxID=1542388 RepID=A0A2R8BM23_9RHOB|nr:hypothetical protein [Defluviimonas aquaemixtae]SPH24475.1 hypothetical protein DEA8626_03527 [Defluviimonas aquaemixtae]